MFSASVGKLLTELQVTDFLPMTCNVVWQRLMVSFHFLTSNKILAKVTYESLLSSSL